MAAPRPTPTILKIAKGNPGKRPLNKLEPNPEPLAEEKPSHLSPAALKHWEHYYPMLIRLHVLTEADKNALCRMCDLLAQLEQASKCIQENGLTINQQIYSRNGDPVVRDGAEVTILKPNPMFKIQIELDKQVKSLMLEFGLTPASRTKVTRTASPLATKLNPLAELRERAKRSR